MKKSKNMLLGQVMRRLQSTRLGLARLEELGHDISIPFMRSPKRIRGV